MKNAIKKAISVLLVAVMVFGAAPLAGFVGLDLPELNLWGFKANALSENGTCGENLTWTFDNATGELVISGTGDIEGYYFSWDDSIQSVIIKDGVTGIGENSFEGCTNIGSVTIPDSVTTIGDCAFSDCPNLANTYYTGTAAQWEKISVGYYNENLTLNIVYEYDPDSLIPSGKCGENLTWKINEEGTELVIEGTGAMTDWTSSPSVPWYKYATLIKKVIVSHGVTTIGQNAFWRCTNLENVTIPDSVTTIGDYAFNSCTNLASVTIGNGVTTIGNYAFNNCTNLASVTIPDSVTSIDYRAFYNCPNLATTYYTGTPVQWEKISIGSDNYYLIRSVTYECNSENPYTGGVCGENLIWKINEEGTELVIEGTGAMTSWSSSSYVPWYNYVSSIKSVTVSDEVTSIGWYAFYNCTSLTDITIGKDVTVIGNDAFTNCKKLENVYYNGDIAGWLGINAASEDCNDSSTPLCYGGNLYFGGEPVTDVEIPEGTTAVRNYAFGGCESLANITIPDGVTSIGRSAFYGCTSLANITIPDSITSIGNFAFSGCTSLANVTIGIGVTTIGNYAFNNCTSLATTYYTGTPEQWKKISIGSYNSYLTQNVICECNSDIPYYGGSCGENLFWRFYSDSGELVINGTGSMTDWNSSSSSYAPWYKHASSIKSVTILDGVTTIGYYAFKNSTSLVNITIPDSVTTIRCDAFYNCTSLASITIPDSVTSIEYQAFYGCTSLASVTIGNSVTTIGNSAFYNCTSLASVTIGNSVTTIDKDAFRNCTSLATTYYTGTPEQWKKISIGSDNSYLTQNVICECNSERPYYGGSCGGNLFWRFYSDSGELVINGMGAMMSNPWYKHASSIKSVTIPDGVTSIGNSAFSGCTSLASITIPDGVTSIGSSAFSGCKSLASITIPDSVTSIGSSAFSGCTSLASITIPDGVTSIGDSAFYNCTSLASITIPDGVTSIGNSAFYNCTSLASVTIGNSVTTIGNSAFYNCTSLVNVTIPDSVTTIGKDAFRNCTSLENVTIGSGLKTVGTYPFSSCKALKNLTVLSNEADFSGIIHGLYIDEQTLMIYCNKNSKTHIYAEENSLAYYLLDGTEEDNVITGTVGTKLTWTIDRKTKTLTIDNKGTMVSFGSETAPWILHEEYVVNVKINYGCTNISTEAFCGCAYLENIDIPYSVTSIGSSAFSGCDSLASITIPDSVTTIGSSAFFGCDSLASITIPDRVTSIGGSAFYNCTSLANITIPDSVTTIGSSAFHFCASLENITIGSGVTSIDNYAFRNCKNLTSVTIPASVTSISDYAFADCSKLYNIYIYNRNCSIYETSITVHATIHGYKGSTAETFADKYGYEFIPIIDNPCEEHTYENSCDIYCDVCGFKREITHTFDEWIIIKEPTCVSLGTKKHICSVCGYSELDKVEMLTEHVYDNACDTSCNSCGELRDITHAYGEWFIIKQPTCAAFGTKKHICTICEAVETDSVAKLTVHTYTNDCDTECDICGKIRKINHTYGEWTVTKEPTCGEYGVKEHTCSICGNVATENVAKLTEHTYTNTCDTDCDVCGATREIVHTYGEWVVTTEPTCGTLGTKEHTCTVCGHVETDIVAKLEYHTYTDDCDEGCNVCGEIRTITHSFGKWTVTQAPTCDAMGVKERVCSVCGHTETGTVDKSDEHTYTDTCDTDCNVCGEIRKINHTFGEWTVTKEPTCDEYGTKERVCSVCGHIATGTVDKSTVHTYDNSCDTDCNVCGATREINHAFSDWALTKEPTCDEYGAKERICSVCGHKEEGSVAKLEDHTYTNSCDTDCDICGVFREINHSYGEWTVTLNPTCSSYGEKIRICSVCGHEEKLTVPMVSEHTFTNSCDTDCNYCGETRLVNHTYGEWTVVQEPNCKYLGVKEQVCTGCGHTKTGSVPKNDAHIFADSCDANCDLCGEVRDVDHSYGDWTVTKQSTCSEFGVKERTCSLCGNVEKADVKKLGHTYEDTCDETCDVCGEERTITHTYGEWVILQEPTCDALGFTQRVCSVCGYEQYDFIVKLKHIYTNDCDADCDVCGETREVSHSFGEWVVIKEATCTENGIKERKCSGGCIEQETIDLVPHIDEDDNGICEKCGNQFEMKYHMNGVCGENLTWEIDAEGTLTISGSGAMYDFGNRDYISINPETKEQVADGTEGSIKVFRWNGHFDKIKKVVIGNGVESISAYAFKGCYNLEKVNVPDVVINIDPSAFDGCGKAAIICKNGSYAHVYAVQNGIKYVLEDNASGAAFEIKNSMLISYNGSASNVVLPAEIASIGVDAFKGNNNIMSVEIPYSVSKIYPGAFANCGNLERVVVPFTVTEIDVSAFNGTNATIYCYNNSYAHNYAIENGIAYELITVTLSTNSADVILGDTLEMNAVPSITLAGGVPFEWSSSNANVAAVDENGNVTANSMGEATISVLAPNGEILATCSVTVIPDEYKVTWIVDGETTEKVYKVGDAVVAPADPAKTGYKFIGWTPEVPAEMPAYDITFTAVFEASGPVNADIIRKPSQTTIKYGDAIILHVDASKIPEGGRVEWKADNGNFKYSANGDTCRIDPNKSGSTTFTATIYDAEGNAIFKDEQTMTSKAGFFDKFVAFFKNLFGSTKVIPQAFKGIY